MHFAEWRPPQVSLSLSLCRLSNRSYPLLSLCICLSPPSRLCLLPVPVAFSVPVPVTVPASASAPACRLAVPLRSTLALELSSLFCWNTHK